MNSLQELLDNGIELYTAENMLKDYSNRIDTMNGIYKIIDINYDFSVRGKDVTLQCTECGKIIHRKMISGRNKWSELIKTCECQKEKKKQIEKEEAEKILQNKKAQILKDVERNYPKASIGNCITQIEARIKHFESTNNE